MPESSLEDIFEQLEADAEETFNEIDTRMETAGHIAKEVGTFGYALTEHEVWIDTPYNAVLL